MKPLSIKFFFVLLFSGLFFQACKKDDKDSKPSGGNSKPIDGNKENALSFTLEQEKLQPGSIAILNAGKDLSNSSYSAGLGEKSIDLVKVDGDRTFSFIVPDLDEGGYELIIEQLEYEGSVQIQILPSTVADPGQVINAFAGQTNDDIATLKERQSNGGNIDDQNIEALELMKEEFERLLEELNEEEKMQLAQFIEVNELDNKIREPIEFNDSFRLKKSDESFPDVQWSRIGSTLIVDGAVISGLSIGFVGLLNAPETFFTKAAAIAAGILLCKQMIALLEDIKSFSNIAGIYAEISNWSNKKEMELTSGEVLTITVNNEYRTLGKGDLSHPSTLVKNVTETVNSINDKWTNFKRQLEKIKSWFSGKPPAVTANEAQLSGNEKSEAFAGNPAFYSIQNVSNGVKLTLTRNGKKLNLKAEADQSTDFTFDLVYNNPDMGYTVRKTINAELEACKDNNPPDVDISTASGKTTFTIDSNAIDTISIRFKGVVNNPPSPSSWQWTFEKGNPGSSSKQNPNVSFLFPDPGAFNVKLKAVNSCGKETEKNISITIQWK